MSATSVLAFIVPKLGIQIENAVSDCLQFILSTHPEAADAFMGYLRPAGLELPAPLEFTTQMMWQRFGARPDLTGMSGEDAFVVLEAKFHAPLTKGQPIE